MKTAGIILLVILQLNAFCQDEIITENDETLTVRIVNEEKKSVSFYLADDQEKVIQTMLKKSVDKIRYEKPAYTANTIAIMDDSRSGRDLFSHVVSFLIESGYELDVFDMEHSRVSALSAQGWRISVEIKDNQALFSCYTREKTVSSSTSQTKGHVIRFREPDEEEKKEILYPGEIRMVAEAKEFKAMDEICRRYLQNNKGSLDYRTDPSRSVKSDQSGN
jgi:protease II